ncbi:MAG: methionyl-tRNA formyltransferase [Desulfobulbaceae bacterium]|uniref:Methionyl-tRNA formyltransferase n=1 Tax=Candidatus Desulfatifera sulfidica TaxID=2841691 RepID=A0A8J6NBE7_9BACT|nr:methionyl-tRNA formyltransferase [Candidatus Desulfatifera sulfidica]
MSHDGPFRIIFMGTPDFAVPALQALIDGPDEIVAVVSQPDRPKGRGKKLQPTPIKITAETAGIPVLQPNKIRTPEFLAELRAFQPDLIVVAAYGRILPKSILELPPLGCINIHGSLLPSHRGAAPIQWAVIRGDANAGVTIMQMDEGMDTGDMLLQVAIPVSPDETAGGLFAKLSELGGKALLTALDRLRSDDLPPIAQDHSLASEAPPLNKEDGCINWNKPAKELHCLIRGLDPWPTAYTFLDNKRFRLFAPQIVHHDSDNLPGTLLAADRQGLLIACGRDALLIRELQPEGKRRMTAQAFLCGQPLQPGVCFDGQ